MKAGPLRIGAFKNDPAAHDALERVQAWTRTRFALPEDSTVLVTELACSIPGCPPLETMVAFWTEDAQRRHFKVFKPVEDVQSDDLPPIWLKDALCAEPGDDFACC
jgi:hypothetical protein